MCIIAQIMGPATGTGFLILAIKALDVNVLLDEECGQALQFTS